MTYEDAQKIIYEFRDNESPTEDEEFLYTEALQQMITGTGKPEYMSELAWYYCERKRFDLELKYLEMAAECGYGPAYEELGYMWYYGQHGEKDYVKAFEYYTKGSQPDRYGNEGSLWSQYKLADMYRFGCAVEKDEARYCAMIEDAWEKVKSRTRLNEPVPEIALRLAGIRSEQGQTEEAVKLLTYAKNFLAERMSYDAFWGHIEVMGRIVRFLYKLTEWNEEEADFYDLFYLTRKPGHFAMERFGETVEIEAAEDESGDEPAGGSTGTTVPAGHTEAARGLAIRYDGRWYRNFEDFCKKAEIEGRKFTTVYDEFYDIRRM